MYSKLKVGGNILMGVDSVIISKEIEKGIKEEKRYFGTFIYENNGI